MSKVADLLARSARILLVEAHAAHRATLTLELAASLPVMPLVIGVANGRAASGKLRTGDYDVVVMDAGSVGDLTPEIDRAVERLVKLAGGALTLVLSGSGSVTAAVEAMRAGAHDFMAKPVDGVAVATRLAELARRHGRAAPLPDPIGVPMVAADLRREPGRPRAVLPMWRQEQRIIEDAIASFSGNITMAAAALEVSPSTIYRKRQAWAEMDGDGND